MSTLDDIKKRAENASPGPWAIDANDTSRLESINSVADDRIGGWVEVARSLGDDADFIANARTDVPKLVAALEAVEAEADALDGLADATYGDDLNAALHLAARGIRKVIAEALS